MKYFQLSQTPVEDILCHRLGVEFIEEIYGKDDSEKIIKRVLQRMIKGF